jgi:hypothetical protein
VSRVTVQATWDDVPHLTDEQRRQQIDAAMPHELEARSKGVPSLGAGKIYPVAEQDIIIDPIRLPNWWPRAYGFDADWNNTAAIWGAWDRESDCVYLYSEYFRQHVEPASHAEAIKARGEYLTGAMDPSTNGKLNPKDGSRLSDEYRGLGLNLVDADNAVEAGIMACYKRMTSGRLKVFSTLVAWLQEFRIYRRVEKVTELGASSKIVKKQDHLMDAMRYLIMTGLLYGEVTPDFDEEAERVMANYDRSGVTGY